MISALYPMKAAGAQKTENIQYETMREPPLKSNKDLKALKISHLAVSLARL